MWDTVLSLEKPIFYERGKAYNEIITKGKYIHIRDVPKVQRREMEERVIHLEESGGWEKDAWRRISRALSSQCREMGWPVSMRQHSILEECQAFLEEKEHPLPGRVEYLWRQLSIHNINGLVFFSLGLCCTWIDGNDHLKVNVSMGKTKEKNFN